MAERNQRRRRAAHFLPQLPKDVLVDNIFSRLPTKLVGMLRCESPMLRTELSTAQFKELHLANTHEDNVIVVNTDYNLEIMSLPFYESVTYDTGYTCNVIIGSCNGLILYLTIQDTLFLTNPITREQVSLPSPPPSPLLNRGRIVYGFGYDSQNRDYKVVALSRVINDPNVVLVDVFSVNRGLWDSINNFPYNCPENYFSHGVYLNGNIQWLAQRIGGGSTMIACFDVVNEDFNEMIAPAVRADPSKIFVLNGFLGMELSRHRTEFRLMREYGLSNSWRIIRIDGRDFRDVLVKPLCSIDESVLMLVGDDNPQIEEKKLILYTLPTRALQEVGQPVRDGGFFRSSLISPIFHN